MKQHAHEATENAKSICGIKGPVSCQQFQNMTWLWVMLLITCIVYCWKSLRCSLSYGLIVTIVENSGTVATKLKRLIPNCSKLDHQLTSVEYQEVFSITEVTGRHLNIVSSFYTTQFLS